MHRDIGWLNTKWWYQLTKVIFFVFGIWAVLTAAAVTWYENIPYAISDYSITCNYGNKSTFLAYSDASIVIYAHELLNGIDSLPSYKKQEIQNACQIKLDELYAKIEAVKKGTDNGVPLFSVREYEVVDGSYFKTGTFAALASVLVLVAMEISRRIFYYVVLGKISPK